MAKENWQIWGMTVANYWREKLGDDCAQVRAFVYAPSKAEAHRLLNNYSCMSFYYFNNYASASGNAVELALTDAGSFKFRQVWVNSRDCYLRLYDERTAK